MIKTTAYDVCNAVITGFYHDRKGNKHQIEHMGTSLECHHLIDALRKENEGSNEVQSVVHSHVTLWCNVPIQANPLMTAWLQPV